MGAVEVVADLADSLIVHHTSKDRMGVEVVVEVEVEVEGGAADINESNLDHVPKITFL